MFSSEDSSLATLIDRHAPDVSLASLQVREELRAPLALSYAAAHHFYFADTTVLGRLFLRTRAVCPRP